jgi:hypothetical protein
VSARQPVSRPLYDELLSIADLARILGVSERDVHEIPVSRWRYKGIPGACYHRSEIEAWRDRELASPNGLLRQLQARYEEMRLRILRSEVQYTKTGKRKKRFRGDDRQPSFQNCLACGSPLASEMREYDQTEDYDDSNDSNPVSPAVSNGTARNVLVEHKGRRGRKIAARQVQMNVDQVRKNAEALAHVHHEPKVIRYKIFLCTNTRCERYGEPAEFHELEAESDLHDLFEHGDPVVDDTAINELTSNETANRDEEE